MNEPYGLFAQIYDSLMGDVDYETWTNYLCELIAQYCPDAKRIADCACGTGAITLRLAKAGFNVTGFDISEQMLEVAAASARAQGIHVDFIKMNMQSLRFHQPCDCIICACDGVNYLNSTSALKKFAACAYNGLKTGGVVLFDISSRYKLQNILGNNTFTHDEPLNAYIWTNNYDAQQHLLEMNLTFFTHSSAQYYTRFTEKHIQRAHSIAQIENALKSAGFTDIKAFDAFTLQSPSPSAERIQFVARRT